jgi:hypothetical protein
VKTKIYLLVFFLLGANLFAQQTEEREITGGMGISFESAPSVIDYLNYNFAQSDQLSYAFNSAIEGWVEYAFRYSDNIKLGAEYCYNYFAYSNVNTIGFIYEFDKTVHAITALGYYVKEGDGYEFKLGGGIGFRYATVVEKIYQTEDYSATGFGMLARAQGLTSLGGNFYANLGIDARYDLIGVASNSDGNLINDATGLEVDLSSLAFSIRIGVSYLF